MTIQTSSITADVSFSNRFSRYGVVVALAVLALLIAAPLWAARADLRLLGEIFTYLALASLWNLLAGYAGLVSVGQQAFVGIGGYALFLLTIGTGVNPMFAIPVAGVVAAVMAVPIILLLLRLRGAYFTIGSWVIAEIFPQVIQQIALVGGGSGITLPAALVKSIAQSRAAREYTLYWLGLALAAFTIIAIITLLRTRWGLALAAMRDNELAARANGIDVNRTRILVFIVAATMTGMVGALTFLQKLTVTPTSAFGINEWTVNIIFITVIGGIGRVEGPIVGTIVFFLLRELLADYGSVYLILLGVSAITVMLVAPKGLWGMLADRYDWQVFPLARHVKYRVE
jgi:branched-chain amino acid transport system permease protein